jgi:hypothetical protein
MKNRGAVIFLKWMAIKPLERELGSVRISRALFEFLHCNLLAIIIHGDLMQTKRAKDDQFEISFGEIPAIFHLRMMGDPEKSRKFDHQ